MSARTRGSVGGQVGVDGSVHGIADAKRCGRGRQIKAWRPVCRSLQAAASPCLTQRHHAQFRYDILATLADPRFGSSARRQRQSQVPG